MYSTINETLKHASPGDVFQLYNDANYHYSLTDEWTWDYSFDDDDLIHSRFFVNEDDFTGVRVDMITRYWHFDEATSTFTLVFVKDK